ncbi:MAG: thymidine kinase [Lachnospiraceae bacterium]|nr:thymidine kinase [Lachnospiraceae bacterium]
MGKLYFKYGAIGSSKTASLLMTKYNYEQKGFKVLLIKPAMDTRDGENVVRSGVGLASAEAVPVSETDNMVDVYLRYKSHVILVDEAQFLKEEQVNQLHEVVDMYEIPVICYGLMTDFTSHLYEGSKRLVEIAESLDEIKTVCTCGRKATVNARINASRRLVKTGEQVEMSGGDRYISLCYKCWSMLK